MNSVSAIGLQVDLRWYQLDSGHWIDLSLLEEMTGHDVEFTKQLIDMFLASAPDAMHRAQKAFEDGQLDEVMAVVHKYKSSLNIMGNPKLSGLASDIETACRENLGQQEIQRRLWILQELTEVVLHVLRDMLSELRP